MHEQTSPYTGGTSGGAAPSTSYTRLTGWRLVAARGVVLIVSALTIGLGIYALVLWPRLAVPCADALNSCLMRPEQVAPLGRLGITPVGLTLAVVGINCVAIALANAVAALLLWRRSDDAMALLVALTLVLLPAFFTPMYQSLTGTWHAAAGVINILGGITFLLLILLFPSGRFVPRWIWVPVLVIIGFLMFGGNGNVPNAVALPLILLCLLSLAGGQIYRYRVVSTPIQRQQTKFAVTGLVLAIAVNQLYWQPAGWVPALQRKDSLYSLLLYPDFALLISIIAVTFGIAILRYRLYDIDVIIRQTLIYGTLTAILAGLYLAIVVMAQGMSLRLTGVSGQQPIVIVATTLVIAALFAPLRRRIQTAIDRAFYRSRYDSALTLSAFGAKMRMETDLDALSGEFVEVVKRTMHPAHASLWLRAPQAGMPAHADSALESVEHRP